MSKGVFSIIGGAALTAFGLGGCLTTYESSTPQVKQAAPADTGPEQSAAQVSNAPVPVRPASPTEQAVAWTESGDPALIAARVLQEGPLEISSAQHACMKVKLEEMGRILEGLGINMKMTNVDPPPANTASLIPVDVNTICDGLIPGLNVVAVKGQTSSFTKPGGGTVTVIADTDSTDAFDRGNLISQPARFVYCDGRLTLGLPLYSGRAAESTGVTTAGITKQFDLFLAAAAEIVKNGLGGASRCMDPLTSKPAVLFNADNTCNEAGITCLQGYPATPDQVALCSRVVTQGEAVPDKTVSVRRITRVRDPSSNQIQVFTRIDATTMVPVPGMDAVTAGKRLAVAAILSAGHACE